MGTEDITQVLLGLGFKKISDPDDLEASREIAARYEKLLSGRWEQRQDRDLFFFFALDGTYASDAEENTWVANTQVDLTPFGFENRTESATNTLKEILKRLKTY